MKTDLEKRLEDLKKDILHPAGIQVSQSQNYPFSIFVYPPEDEFYMREQFLKLINDVKRKNIQVLEINLAHRVIEFAKKPKDDWSIEEVIQREKDFFSDDKDYKESIPLLEDFLTPILVNQDGISETVKNEIYQFHNSLEGRDGIVFLTRAGFLYPFYRTSALLKYLTDTKGIPVVFLYPGKRVNNTSLSYMGMLEPDTNYRPRMY